jgi:hypothetical protein
MLSYAETEMVQDEVDRLDALFLKKKVSNEVMLELAARVLGMYLVGGRRFGVPDSYMIDNARDRAKKFADAFISEIEDVP